MEVRPYYLAREWVRAGHSVLIVASSVSHVRAKNPKTVGKISFETIDNINYCWIRTPIYHGNNLGRAINIFTFISKLWMLGKHLAKQYKPDLVVASSTYPLDIFPCRRIAKIAKSKLIYEVHDLWPLSLIELGGMPTYHPFILLLQWAENVAYREADHVISMLPNALEHMQYHGMKTEKFLYIPNGINASEWESEISSLPPEHAQCLIDLKRSERFTVGYTGAHGLANALDTLIDAAKLVEEFPVSFVLVGQGPEKERLKHKVDDLRLKNIFFLPSVSKAAIPLLLRDIDCAYIGLKKESLFRFGVSPNKLMDYMMAAKPVISAIEAGNDLVAESGCGFSIPAENPMEISLAIQKMVQLTPSERELMGQRGHRYIKNHHDYQVLAKKFLDILQ
jgi:glycosyltransferase involved in cell wall biosynthesis